MTSQTCPKCGLTESAGAYCSRCEAPTGPGAWKQDANPRSEALAPPIALYQRCRRCGTDEASGSFCTWCRTAEYDLIEHTHMPKGGKCPLGPYMNPSFAESHSPAMRRRLSETRAAWDASHDPAEAEPFITRRWTHPAAKGAQRHATAA